MKDISKTIELGAFVAIAVSALAVAGVFIAGEARSWSTPSSSAGSGQAGSAQQQAVYLDGWEEYVDKGLVRGSRQAPVKLIEFVDFECPFCRQQAARIDSLLAEFPEDVQVTTHHFPLTSIHRFAKPTADAVECAELQDRGTEFAAVVFEKQDLLGLKPWSAYAEEAGIADVERFEECRTGAYYFPRIAQGMAFGERAGVTLTPTLVVNGWKLAGAPSSTEAFREIVRTVLSGEAPASGDTISVEPPEWELVEPDSMARPASSGGTPAHER